MTDFATAKHNMIEQQIRPWEVLDPQVLEVFNRVDRDHFVPEQYKGLAYADCQLPVFEDESMLPPTVEGRMLQALRLEPSDSVLEIGSCSGYITACLARLANRVTSVDFNTDAIELASKNLAELGINNVQLQSISRLQDIDQTERYDAITVNAGSLNAIPENLKTALAIGGRMFVITGQSPAKHAQLVERVSQTEWSEKNLFETDIPALKQHTG